MKFTFDNNAPIYVQIVEQIKISIISGDLKSGERLPSVRDLALESKVNPNTMQKALIELEETGLIYTERTNGKFITEDTALILSFKKKYADELSAKFLRGMQNIGYDNLSALKYIEKFGGKAL